MDASVVVDASVWVSWLRPSEVNHDASSFWIEQYIATGKHLIVPELLLIEVAASISRQTRQAVQAKEAIETLHSINKIQIVSMDSILVQAAVEVAINLQLRAGDAIYVALAHQLNIPLVSWDREHLQRTGSLIATYTPSDYPFPEEDQQGEANDHS